MNNATSYEFQTNENVLTRRKRALAIGATALTLAGALSSCGSNETADVLVERSAYVAQLEKDYVTAYSCTIDSKSLGAVAAKVDEVKHLYFPGYVSVTLNLAPSKTGKDAIKNLADDKSILTISDVVDKDGKDNIKAPLFSTVPFDTPLPDNVPVQATQDDFKNQVFKVNKDGTATLKSYVRYTLDEKGQTEDKDISIIQELYTKDEVNSYITRGKVACGTIKYDGRKNKKRAWQVLSQPIIDSVTFNEYKNPHNQQPSRVTSKK